MYAILGAASALKLGLWLYCRTLQKNPIMVALAQVREGRPRGWAGG